MESSGTKMNFFQQLLAKKTMSLISPWYGFLKSEHFAKPLAPGWSSPPPSL
jgi:hypothetical protein